MSTRGNIIVLGGGVAGIMTAIELAESGQKVDVFSRFPFHQSGSVCSQGGINAAVNTKGENDSPWQHFQETILGGDFLANQPPVKEMCEEAPALLRLLERLGVLFNRTPEGQVEVRQEGGSQYRRTAFTGTTTGFSILQALDRALRKYEAQGLIERYIYWEFLQVVFDSEERARGIVALHRHSQEVKSFRGEALIVCTGGFAALWGRSTNTPGSRGAAAARLFQQGVRLANLEFVQFHPTTMPGIDKMRPLSESIRAEGGRLWTVKDGRPWYFLEEWYPEYGNLVPRDIASRAIHKVLFEMNLRIDNQAAVHLDITHISSKNLQRRLAGVLKKYQKFTGLDPFENPILVAPAAHYAMGGIWIDENHQTTREGIFAAGEVEYGYHGANRLGGNSLLSCLYGGRVAARKALQYCRGLKKSCEDLSPSIFDRETRRQEKSLEDLKEKEGRESPRKIEEELALLLDEKVSIIRDGKGLEEALDRLLDLRKRSEDLNLKDKGNYGNFELVFAANLPHLLNLSWALIEAAKSREESRGAHYREDFSRRNDEKFLQITMVDWSDEGPKLSYKSVDTSYLRPRPRHYEKK